jgi:hypothetical protein
MRTAIVAGHGRAARFEVAVVGGGVVPKLVARRVNAQPDAGSRPTVAFS